MSAEMCIPETRKVNLFINCVVMYLFLSASNSNVMSEHLHSILPGKISICDFWTQQGVTQYRWKFTRGLLILLSQDDTWSSRKSPELILKWH